MEPAEFAQRLSALTGPEITALASRLRSDLATADAELSWWRATVTIGANLKRHHRSREAGIAAHRATAAVLQAAEDATPAPNRDDVTAVARAASEVARVLVAAHDGDVPPATVAVLLGAWHPFVPTAA